MDDKNDTKFRCSIFNGEFSSSAEKNRNAGFYIGVNGDSNNLMFGAADGSRGGWSQYRVNGFSLPVGEWVHIGVVDNQGVVSFYKNGRFTGSSILPISTTSISFNGNSYEHDSYMIGKYWRTGTETAYTGYPYPGKNRRAAGQMDD